MIMIMMKPRNPLCLLFLVFYLLLIRSLAVHDVPSSNRTTIIFTTLGRSSYAFDVYAISMLHAGEEVRLTDGYSVNFNGHFPSPSPIIPSLFSNQTSIPDTTPSASPPIHLMYVTERGGVSSIYLDAIYNHGATQAGRRSILEFPTQSTRIRVSLLGDRSGDPSKDRLSMKDRPTLVGEDLIYVSNHENTGVPRTSWAAIYSTRLTTGLTRRLTPYGVADFSPAVSPSGVLTAVASYGKEGWGGEVQELDTDIYVFLTSDGSNRVKVVEHGGWPAWADESTLYFHRRCDDGWWSIYRAILPQNGKLRVNSVVTQRVTPPGLHAFTPAAVANKSFIALATRRLDSDFRHIELYDVVSNEFREMTRPIAPNVHHFNPFISPDSTRIGYHRCRGTSGRSDNKDLFLENLKNPVTGISLFRVDGSFPSFSPDGSRIAFVNLPGLYVVNSNGSGLRKILTRNAFPTAWDPKRKGVVYTSLGPDFASESTKVDIVSFNVDEEELNFKKLTTGGENNAFASPSPDGKWVVFRSGRSGHKNLYIMDAVEGETGHNGLQRLTQGPWTDTMCNWSPDGDWIAFASDRDNPGAGSFAIYMIHPNGTGLRKLVESGSGGRANHPCFSPDGKYIVFTSDYAGVSAEPISNPHHFQPYGEIFIVRSDGSGGIQRLTYNSYEDGTPAWGPKYLKPVDVAWPNQLSQCSFEDCHWLSTRSKNDGFEDGANLLGSARIQCGQ